MDAYFTLFIPSSFIFQPQRVKRDYMDGALSPYVRDSIFSIATLFLAHLSGSQSQRYVRDVGSIPQISRFGEDWVERASLMLLDHANRPSLDTLRTLFNLMAYCCATGKTQKFQENAKSAYSSVQTLITQCSSLYVGDPREISRSCFWVRMISQWLPDLAWRSRAMLPANGFTSLRPTNLDPGNSIRDQIFKFIELWSRVRQFVSELDVNENVGLAWATLFSLDSEVRQVYEALPHALRTYSGQQTPGIRFDEVLGIQALHCMCRFIPHLAMVLFLRKQDVPAEDYIQFCAQISSRHINHISNTITNCIAWADGFTLPPFVAYCSFISASVYSSLLSDTYVNRAYHDSNDDPIAGVWKAHLLAHVYLLNQLQHLWAPVRLMWQALQSDMARARISTIDLEIPMGQMEFRDFVSKYLGSNYSESPLPPSINEQLESRTVVDLPDVIGSVQFLDPTYILVGIYRLFPVARPQTHSAFGDYGRDSFSSSKSHTQISSPISQARYRMAPATENPDTFSQSTPKTSLADGEHPSRVINPSSPDTAGIEGDDSASMRMLQMMWLDGEDLLCL
ncbi:hypothetical protein BDV25DRAFT_103021 [Aspergillus avenaceus]|uniref:Transcription factor domain-containing protein n=1 Tax=Aspergillus avenaceus TaxID=36643 RepID=A0A5N6U7K8_ASPAV|nr:hypothetical protein BDV25DRAFT_103021 [Aspergillus avenaceus]